MAAAMAGSTAAAMRPRGSSSSRDTLALVGAQRLQACRSFVATVRAAPPPPPLSMISDEMHALLARLAPTSSAERDALEKLITTQIHDVAFGAGPGEREADEALSARLLAIQRDEQAIRHLQALASPFCDSSAETWDPAIRALTLIGKYRAASDKILLLVNACRIIERRIHELSSAIASSRRAAADSPAPRVAHPSPAPPPPPTATVGADEFFPVLVYVLLRANPPGLHSSLEYISRFRDREVLRGVQGCYFTHVRAAACFLETLDQRLPAAVSE